MTTYISPYEMHEWVSNELITADKLNHIEHGIADIQAKALEGVFQNDADILSALDRIIQTITFQVDVSNSTLKIRLTN